MSLHDRLAHIYWVGGSPCAGKSTIVDRLAEKHGLLVYRCDDAWYRHCEHARPDDHPFLTWASRATADEIWLRPVDQQLTGGIEIYREEFPMILDDLLRLSSDHPIIAEGAALMPDILSTLPIHPHRQLWMVPTESFQRHHYSQREWRHDVLRETSDPERAWENWMARDASFDREVARQATILGYHLITVEGTRPIHAVAAEAAVWFEL